MPELDSQTRHALSRARWAIFQTGLITSGLALFGVYVLGCRDVKSFAMEWYFGHWIAIGPLIVGTVCASGYIIGAQWNGLRIRGWVYVAILLLQLTAFVAAHYAEYATGQPFWRDTHEPLSFTEYAKYVAQHVGADADHPHPKLSLAYSRAALQLLEFSLAAILSPLALSRQPHCRFCGGVLQQRVIGFINSPADIPRLTHFAGLGDAAPLRSLLQPNDLPTADELKITLARCAVCHQGHLLTAGDDRTPIDLSRKLVQTLWITPAKT